VPRDDASRLALVREQLYTPVLGDVLDQVGRRHQFLPPTIMPIRTDFVLVGRAMPVLVADVFGPQAKPYGLLTEALDQLLPGEVYVAHGGRAQAASWGEILTVTAKLRGAVGAVIDGFHRDTPQVLTHDWPVFSRGAYAPDSGPRSSVTDFRVDVEIGAVGISPGDLIVGDRDGVVVVPRSVEDEVLELALSKVAAENEVLKAIENGMSSTEAFARFGVL
jgi:4-hydroxy-4-methyl-2-oxoglutarate aldolase